MTEIRDQWAPDLEIGAYPRADQAVAEMRHRYANLVKLEKLRALAY